MAIETKLPYYSGTSGLVLTIPKRSFPGEFQDKTRLYYYASLYNSIEINSSFYKVPMSSTVKKWSEMVPGHFKFTYKLWKGITHNKQLEFKPEDVVQFMNTIDQAGDRKGCLLIQFPPSLTISNLDQLKNLLQCIFKADPQRQWSTAVEFRHRSWYQQEVYELFQQENVSLVIQDHPSSITPILDPWTDMIYLRFHGINGDYKGSYAAEFLKERALQIREWLKVGKTVYVYFNNTIGDAVLNLEKLNDFVGDDANLMF